MPTNTLRKLNASVPSPASPGSAFERGSAGKLVNQIRMLAKEERAKQNAASGSHSVNMHAYAANRLEAVLLAFGVSKDWPNAGIRDDAP